MIWKKKGGQWLEEPTPLRLKNAIAWKNQVNNTIYQYLQVDQLVNMMQNLLLIFLTFSSVLALPIEEYVEDSEGTEAVHTKVEEEDEAARNARFNFGYSIQVSHYFFRN